MSERFVTPLTWAVTTAAAGCWFWSLYAGAYFWFYAGMGIMAFRMLVMGLGWRFYKEFRRRRAEGQKWGDPPSTEEEKKVGIAAQALGEWQRWDEGRKIDWGPIKWQMAFLLLLALLFYALDRLGVLSHPLTMGIMFGIIPLGAEAYVWWLARRRDPATTTGSA